VRWSAMDCKKMHGVYIHSVAILLAGGGQREGDALHVFIIVSSFWYKTDVAGRAILQWEIETNDEIRRNILHGHPLVQPNVKHIGTSNSCISFQPSKCAFYRFLFTFQTENDTRCM